MTTAPPPGADDNRIDHGAIAVLCGGVGAAKLLRGLLRVVDPATVTAIVNVADDTVLHGLHISPDLDTVVYTLAGEDDTERGWGLRGETWLAMAETVLSRPDLREASSPVASKWRIEMP